MFRSLDAALRSTPFTGKHKVDFLVVCKETYLSENYKEWGLTIGKEYRVIEIEGQGDPIDVCIELNDCGVKDSYFSSFFTDKEQNIEKFKKIYIIGDIVVDFTKEEYEATFSKEQINDLENREKIEWVDENEKKHIVRLVLN